MSETIYHITLPETWEASKASGRHTADSLQSEGFIHCSTRTQVGRSLNRFYKGVPEVRLLAIDPLKLESELKYEAAHEELFPHIYGPLNLDAVTGVESLTPDEEGAYHYPV